MCIAPTTQYIGPKGEKRAQQVACHECWQCIETAINDWQGRNIAESKTAVVCHAVTLTYGRNHVGESDHVKAVILTYSDVQKYLKLLRRHGFPVRYFVTGEYGGLKGRSHWHIMLYWQQGMPKSAEWFPGGKKWRNDPTTKKWVEGRWEAGQIPLDWNFIDEFHWPHGYSFWTAPTAHAVRYNCKYINKGMGEAERQGHLAMSKKPPLGAEYFAMLAARYVDQGMAPQGAGPHDDYEHGDRLIGGFEYTFSDVKMPDGKPVRFRLRDVSLQLFLGHFVRLWAERRGGAMPSSPLVEEFIDPGVWGPVPPLSRPLVVRKTKGRRDAWFRNLDDARNDALDDAWAAGFNEERENGEEQQQQSWYERDEGIRASYQARWREQGEHAGSDDEQGAGDDQGARPGAGGELQARTE